MARVNSFTRAAVALLRTPTHPRFEIIVPCDGLDHPINARRNGVNTVCPLARQNIPSAPRTGRKMEEFIDLRNHVRQKLLFRLFWANERLDRWGTWPAPGRRSTGLGHQDPRSGEPSSQTGPPYSSWKSGEWKIQPRICGKCGFFFPLGRDVFYY